MKWAGDFLAQGPVEPKRLDTCSARAAEPVGIAVTDNPASQCSVASVLMTSDPSHQGVDLTGFEGGKPLAGKRDYSERGFSSGVELERAAGERRDTGNLTLECYSTPLSVSSLIQVHLLPFVSFSSSPLFLMHCNFPKSLLKVLFISCLPPPCT
jgi:hypothetical protein